MNRKRTIASLIAASSFIDMSGASASLLLANSIYQMTLDAGTSVFAVQTIPDSSADMQMTDNVAIVNGASYCVLDGGAGILTLQFRYHRCGVKLDTNS